MALGGEVLLPGDAAYDAARAVCNGAIDRRPAVIARCESAADVARAIGFARAHGLELAVRGGGHNYAGFAVCEGGLMLDLSRMNRVTVNPAARRAVCGGRQEREQRRPGRSERHRRRAVLAPPRLGDRARSGQQVRVAEHGLGQVEHVELPRVRAEHHRVRAGHGRQHGAEEAVRVFLGHGRRRCLTLPRTPAPGVRRHRELVPLAHLLRHRAVQRQGLGGGSPGRAARASASANACASASEDPLP